MYSLDLGERNPYLSSHNGISTKNSKTSKSPKDT